MDSNRSESLLDTDIPSGLPPTLTPTRYEPPPPLPTATTKTYTWREWGEWLVKDVPKDIKRKVTDAYRIFKNKVLSLYGKQPTVKSTLVSSAIKKTTAKWMIPGDEFKDPWVFLNSARSEVERIVNSVEGAKKLGEQENPTETVSLYLHDDNHYCVIKDLSRLIAAQLSKGKRRKFICLRCINAFGTEKLLAEHTALCEDHKLQHHYYPSKGSTTFFKNFERLHEVPFMVNADFECFLEPMDHVEGDPKTSFTIQYQKHRPSGFSYTIKCMDKNVYKTKFITYTAQNKDEDIGKIFVNSLEENLKPVYEILKKVTPISMTEKDKKNYTGSNNCYACNIQFGTVRINEWNGKEEKVIKCRDHCHITGKYRGAACDKCNLRMRTPKFVPILFHNLESYDAHLFVKSLGFSEGDINCIPKTDEKYISFSKKIPMETIISPDGEKTLYLEMRFIDSYKFTLASLDSLANTLGEDDFRTLESQMKHSGIELLKRKGVFPYEFMTGYDKLQYDKLPSKKEFYSKLNNPDISDEDYEHAQKVWKTFDCKTMRDYHDL
ncbi:uncharacterized transposon-derived, partial [Paramuricea clavata]